jgi:glycosyltransferase involved in cell wall biosynthesis
MLITDKPPLSVSIISFNEEENIGRTLESIQEIAAEIIVVDAHSADRTREIAAGYGARVYTEEWKGHIRQKNSALEKCSQPWILAIDCDEVVSPDLKQSILQKVNSSVIKGYSLNRRSFYLGKLLMHAWQPDWKLRLVHRSLNPRWTGYDPHDVLTVEGDVERLHGDLIHYSYQNLDDHLERLVRYARITADSYRKTGRKFNWCHLLLNPVAAFLKKYLLQRSFLDGTQGFFVAMSSFIYVFLKYAFLWELEQSGASKTVAGRRDGSLYF